jgi:hypothetical protein
LRLCVGTTKAGKPCQRPAQGSRDTCIGHDPTKAGERRRTASRGGRGRVNAEVRAIKKLMDSLTTKVLAGSVEPKTTHAVVALQNVKLRAVEVGQKLEEADVRREFEELKRVLGVS